MTEESTEIRSAEPADLAAIRRLFVDALDREPIQRAQLAELLFTRPPAEASFRLVADDRGHLVGAAFGSVHGGTGFIDGIAVAGSHRRAKIATRLLAALEEKLRAAGVTTLKVGGNTWYYAWPGVDRAYTPALSLFERTGYRHVTSVSNMTLDLDTWIPGIYRESLREPRAGITLRRATVADASSLEEFVQPRFTPVWASEIQMVLRRETPPAFVAISDGTVVGFACHGVYRTDWFGPLGIDVDQRGSGIGEALLRLCIDDLAAAGIAQVQIGWIGPARFYSKTVGARCDRVFALMEK